MVGTNQREKNKRRADKRITTKSNAVLKQKIRKRKNHIKMRTTGTEQENFELHIYGIYGNAD